MKVLLANAPWRKKGFYGVRAGSRWPHFEACESGYMPFPFFLAYSAALLEENGFEVTLIDAIAEGLSDDEFYYRVFREQPDFILFEVSTPSIITDLAHLDKTRELLGKEIPIAFAGLHFEMFEPLFLKKIEKLDFVLVGEYEFTLLELAQKLRDRKPPDGVLGIVYRTPNGDIVKNPLRPLEKDLSKFPWPARHLLPMDKYNDVPGGIPLPSLQMWASRGCPFQCIFCAWPQIMYGGNKYRPRQPEDVIEEVAYCIEKYKMKSVYFDDDTFNIGKNRIIKFANLMRERGINVPWAIMARADTMKPEMLEAMKKAGLSALKYGVESASQELLNRARKGLDLKKVRETIKFTREMGIPYHLTFMFGLPGETRETARLTIEFCLEMDPDSVQFSIATPYPGSEYYRMLEEKGYLMSRNYEEYDGYHKAVIRTDELTPEDLEEIVCEANKMWQTHMLRKKLKKSPWKALTYIFRYPKRVPIKLKQLLGVQK